MRVILFGSWGEKNLGDDLMLCTLIINLRKNFPNTQIVIFTGSVKNSSSLLQSEGIADEDLHLVYTGRRGLCEPGKKFSNCFNWLFLNLYETFRADLLLIGPGNQIQDVTRKYRVLFFVSRALLAWIFRTPYAYFGISFFLVRNRFCRYALKFTANRCAFVSTRDEGSAKDFHLLGIEKNRIWSLNDVSFSYPWAPIPVYRKKSTDQPSIGVNSRIFLPEIYSTDITKNFESCYASLLKHIHRETGAKFRFFIFYRDSQWHDGIAFERLLALINDQDFPLELIPFRNIRRTQQEMLTCDMFIGVRYHSILISIQNNLPVLALGYGKKTWRFMLENGLSGYCLKMEDITEVKIKSLWQNLWQNPEVFQRLAKDARIEATRKSEINYKLIQQKGVAEME